MKKIALISSFCDTDEKIKVLSENLTTLKSLGVDTFVISPLKLPIEIIDKSDFVFFTKENPVLVWPQRAFTFWKTIHTKVGWIKIHHTVSDYGWAALYQIKKMSEIALTYDYDIFYHMIYDLDIDETVMGEIKSNVINIIHPRINPQNPNEIWQTTLHFIIFDREKMSEVVNRINLQNYLSKNGVAEDEAFIWANELPLKISETPVKDKIYYWKGKDFFNYSNSSDFKFYISKNSITNIIEKTSNEKFVSSSLKMLFYDIVNQKQIIVIINDQEFIFNLKDNFLFDSNFPSEDVQSIMLKYDGKIHDFTEDYKKISRNLIYNL